MATSIIPHKGKCSPEYLAAKKHYIGLVSVINLSVNECDASWRLFEAGMISPPAAGTISAQDMVKSVLQCVMSDAMNFYKFLAILDSLSRTVNILKDIQQEFFCKAHISNSSKVHYVCIDYV